MLLGVAAVFELVAMSGMLSDPGPGRDDAEFEKAKSLGALLFFIIPLLAVGVLAVVHLAWRSSRRREQRYLRAHRS